MVQKKGAAIVVRVLYAGHYCHQGQVRLQKIVDGRTSTTSFVEIGQQTGRYGADGLKFFAETAVKMATINLKWLSKEVAGEDVRTSFRPIAPGRYAMTFVNCNSGGNQNTFMGAANFDVLQINTAKKALPILGDNSILIGHDQIVDAGTINIVPMGSTGFSRDRIARVEGSEAPREFREAIRQSLPDFSLKITYTKFSPYLGALEH